MNGPRDFFEDMVKPAYADWQKDILSERKMRTVTIFLDSMADWMFVHCEMGNKYGARGRARYRDYLAKKTPAFGFIRDTADCTKHVELLRSGAISNNARLQRLLKYKSFDEVIDVDALDDWDAQAVWIIENKDLIWTLSPRINAVMRMWDMELRDAGL